MGSDLCQVCWLVKNSEGQRERDGKRLEGLEGGERKGKLRREREREKVAVTMSQNSHISLSYTGMILPFGMTLP